jgi:hypothetical protein
MAVVALLVAVQARELGPHATVEESTCWECHSSWTPPLKAVAVLIPPDKVEAAVGEPFEYKVQLQNTWRAGVVFASPTLDLSGAPSLRFAGGHAPIDNRTSGLRISPVLTSAGEPTDPVTTDFFLPPGATRLFFSVVPVDTNPNTAPNLVMVVQPPSGAALEFDDAGPGLPEEHGFTGAELAAMGSGTYKVGASFTPVAANPPNVPGTPVLTPVDFDVVEQAEFDTAGLTSLGFSRAETVNAGLSALYTWTLVAAAEPAQPEEIRLFANVTAYYDHLASTPPTGDDDNVTHLSVVAVKPGGGMVQLVNENAVMVRPETIDSATIVTVSEAVGYAAAFLLLSSIWSGGMFGKATRRSLNGLFGSAKRRVAFHNFLSYGLTLAAAVHTVLFIVEASYAWGWGLLWGGLGLLAMLLLGVTGALQVPMVRKWNYATWRWTHYGLTVAAILFTVVHIFLDGKNTGPIQEQLKWTGDPLRDLGEAAVAAVVRLF